MPRLPRETGNLIPKRYFGLRGVYQRFRFPPKPSSYLSNLVGLYTLDLRGSSTLRVNPDALLTLESLKHLLLHHNVVVHLKSLRNLETLKCVNAKCVTRDNAVFQWTNLRNVEVCFGTGEEVEVVLKSPFVASGLVHSLNMEMLHRNSFPNLEKCAPVKILPKQF
ncbi:hypothetical protein M5689_001968 [Euphorbia peplus]|nr:hypothetical protein M5689_001968 [Euphorbia peplus]